MTRAVPSCKVETTFTSDFVSHLKILSLYTNGSKFTQRYLDQGFQMVMLGAGRVTMSNYMKAEVERLTGWTPLNPVGALDKGGY